MSINVTDLPKIDAQGVNAVQVIEKMNDAFKGHIKDDTTEKHNNNVKVLIADKRFLQSAQIGCTTEELTPYLTALIWAVNGVVERHKQILESFEKQNAQLTPVIDALKQWGGAVDASGTVLALSDTVVKRFEQLLEYREKQKAVLEKIIQKRKEVDALLKEKVKKE